MRSLLRLLLPEKALALLASLKSDAIEAGSGPTDVYVFVDPNCPHSRDFVDMVFGNEKMLQRYHYYFFLYPLPLFRSGTAVNAIYSAPSPKAAMIDYMIRRHRFTLRSRVTPPAVQMKIRRIVKAAEQIGIVKRPYLILDKKKQP